MGAGLLFGGGGGGGDDHDDGAHYDEKRTTLNYGSILPSPVTHPNPTVARSPKHADGPLVLDVGVANGRTTPDSLFNDPSPMSPFFPKSPSPVMQHNPRSSQDSLGAVSIASSGVFSPSMISWPMPPSTAPSIKTTTSPPTTSHGLSPIVSYEPMPPVKSVKPVTPRTPKSPMGPLPPSNWEKPPGWE
ncbi:hypothetical protein B0T17DRAFT_490190 [Bombardia bombarda]|uniref:Uncharacterized protein n=1 Tax=Bombardia bombarda TaxID=252184 RepID=A0AA40C9K3_9PEZI|nr:hypothetical protein B0T17DRAFT_490190 [Bombardia bombarda]